MTKNPLLIYIFSILCLSGLLFASDPLGTATDYNLFVIGDLTHTGGDSEGAIAVGGNAVLTSYGVGTALSTGGNAQGYGMVIGGNLNFTNGQSYHGDIHVGGTVISAPTIVDGELVNPSTPIDFDSEETYLVNLSEYWSNYTVNGSYTLKSWGRLILTGTSNDLNVFYIPEDVWKSTTEVYFSVPDDAKVIINVEGESDAIPSDHSNFGSIFLNGQSQNNIVWNFFEATDLSIQNISWQGSLLAPLADFSYASGNIEGTLVVKSCSMTNYSGEVHDYPLEGDFPQPDSEELEKVVPLLECVIENSKNNYTAYFGYYNPNADTVEIAVGDSNYFSPGQKDRGQLTKFAPGRSDYYPSYAFAVTWTGNTDLIWTLDEETVTASNCSNICSEHVYFEKEWLDANGDVESSVPSDLPSEYYIQVTSEFGTATGTYNNSNLEWTYSNTPSYSDSNGLWVPVNGEYVVKEYNLPDNYSEYDGTGTYTAVFSGGYAESPYLDSASYALHTIQNKKDEDVCATSATVTMGADTSICMYDADSISVDVEVSLTPSPSRATVQAIWQLTYPDSAENDNSKHYLTFDITNDTSFTLTGYWPGVTSEDSLVELNFSVVVVDCDDDTLANQTKAYHWDATVCKAPDPEVADLELEKTVDKTNPDNGDNVTFTVKVTNKTTTGAVSAPDVVVYDLLPSGLDFVSASASQGIYNDSTGLWSIGTISVGASVTLKVTATVNISDMSTTAVDLGVAADYNVFVLQDIDQPSADTQGKMAVGRNAEFTSYSVGDQLDTFGDDVLIVDGNLTYNSGRVYNGNVVYGNSTNLPIGVASVDGDISQGHPIDFDAAASYLKNLSTELSSYTVNGTDTLDFSTLQLTGTDPYLNIFKVDGDDLNNSYTFDLNVPKGSVVLVNIDGTDVTLSGGWDIGDADSSNILYNFYNASDLTIASVSVYGSLLAPFAEVHTVGGDQYGQMIAKYIDGSEGHTQFNEAKFIGNIPADTTLINVAEVYSSGIDDPNSIPNNGDASENDYDYATVSVGYSDNTSVEDDEGNEITWESVGSFGTNEIVYAMAVDTSGSILAGTWGGKIYKSSGEGESLTWEVINSSMNVSFIWSIVVDSASNKIYVGTEGGVYNSTDGGESWSQTDTTDVRALAIDPDGNLYAGTWGLGIYKSTDDGATWTLVNDGLDSKAVSALIVDSNSDIYAGTFGGGIYKSVDGGDSWSQLDVGYDYIWSLGVTSTNKLYAGTYGSGVYYSKDGGESWSISNGNLSSTYVYSIMVDSDDNVYISTWSNGVYKTSNTGLTWSSYGLAGTGVSSIALGADASEIYAGTSSGKVLSISNSITGVEATTDEEELETSFELYQNYPNPFNPTTTIKFSVKESGTYKIRVFNILGQLVTTLINKELQAGEHQIVFNARHYASGVYIYNLAGQGVSLTKKMVLIK